MLDNRFNQTVNAPRRGRAFYTTPRTHLRRQDEFTVLRDGGQTDTAPRRPAQLDPSDESLPVGRRVIHLLLFVHHRGVVRLPFSISTLERASCRLSVLRDHAAA